ncbi:MAG: hypothetical protein ACFFFK_09865 [Candidatus Thorarchaeota archaeon]
MTTEIRHEEVLDLIGVDTSRKDMIILGAILKAQRSPSDFIDFETLREQLAIDEGSRKGKDPLIYRTLSTLEKDGFLKIDKGSQKHGYCSNIAMLEKALSKIIAKNVEDLEKELKEIDAEIETISEMSSDRLASGVIEISTGRKTKKSMEKPIFAQGWDNILKLLDDKIYGNIKRGDIVRIKLEWLSDIDYLKPKRAMNIQRLLNKGIEIRALDHDRGEQAFRNDMKELLEKMQGSGGNIAYRVFPRDSATYQFIGKNSEGIVLVVSEHPLSATWMPRSGNVELVDTAIDSFDKDFKKGIDLLEFEG